MERPYYVPAISFLRLLHQGKTRDTYQALGGHLLVYATDRLSTHNVVHKSEVPKKGEVLTALTVFWLTQVLGPLGVNHHLVAYGRDIYKFLPEAPENRPYPAYLHLRAIVVKKLDMIPVEFIYRNYMVGSLFDKFYSKGLENPYGILFSPGLQVMSRFTTPVFTPTDKSETDDPLNTAETMKRYPEAHALALESFTAIREHLRGAGVEFIDSKFELGLDSEGRVCLADEVGTPDSSRYCRLRDVTEGKEPPWLDKQIARDEAMQIWNGGPKVPLTFSPEIIDQLTETYVDVFVRATNYKLSGFQEIYLD